MFGTQIFALYTNISKSLLLNWLLIGERTLIFNICWFSWCKYSHSGQFQATNTTPWMQSWARDSQQLCRLARASSSTPLTSEPYLPYSRSTASEAPVVVLSLPAELVATRPRVWVRMSHGRLGWRTRVLHHAAGLRDTLCPFHLVSIWKATVRPSDQVWYDALEAFGRLKAPLSISRL